MCTRQWSIFAPNFIVIFGAGDTGATWPTRGSHRTGRDARTLPNGKQTILKRGSAPTRQLPNAINITAATFTFSFLSSYFRPKPSLGSASLPRVLFCRLFEAKTVRYNKCYSLPFSRFSFSKYEWWGMSQNKTIINIFLNVSAIM